MLYPLLRQLENEGLITSSWDAVRAEDSDEGAEGRKRKWYRLSPKGKRRLGQRVAAYESLRKAIDAFVGVEAARGGLTMIARPGSGRARGSDSERRRSLGAEAPPSIAGWLHALSRRMNVPASGNARRCVTNSMLICASGCRS